MDFELKYDGDNMFLEKAKDIADKLLPAWNTPSGIPYNTINLAHGNAHNPGWTGGDSIPVDSGTEQLEFIALSQRAGDLKYQQKVENVILELNKTFPADGLLPNYINPHRGTPSHSTITFGAMGDSFLDQNVQIRPFMTARVNEYASYLTKHYNALLPNQSVSSSTSLIKSFLFFHLSILRNAGRGSNFTEDGDVECDASLMDGKSRSFRAVGAVPSNYYQV